jgi:hypothetical protein
MRLRHLFSVCGHDMKRWFYTSALLALLVPGAAEAHLAVTGLGPVYDGIYHLALSPRQIFPLVAVSLYAGLRGAAQSRAVCLAVPLAWIAGCMFGPSAAAPLIVPFCLLLTGGLLAAAPPLGPWLVAAIAAVISFAVSYAYDAPPGLGTGIGGLMVVLVLTPLAASISLPLRRLQALIAVRVAGSWIAALGLLMAGWWINGQGR